MRFVLAFVETGVGLPAIRNCLSLAKQVLQSDRPFLSGRFRTDGKTIFLESLGSMPGEASVLDLRNGQLAFKTVIERTFRDLDLEDNSVSRWRPFGGKPSIVIDPKRSFGQPIATLSGVPTITLAESVKAEGSISRVAAIFDISRSAVQDAVKFHEELLAA